MKVFLAALLRGDRRGRRVAMLNTIQTPSYVAFTTDGVRGRRSRHNRPCAGALKRSTEVVRPRSPADQVMAGIADPDAVGRECDIARRLDGVEQ